MESFLAKCLLNFLLDSWQIFNEIFAKILTEIKNIIVQFFLILSERSLNMFLVGSRKYPWLILLQILSRFVEVGEKPS